MTTQSLAYEEYELPEIFTGVREQFVSRSGGMSIAHYGTFLRVKNEYTADAVVYIYSADGRLISRETLNTSSGYVDVSTYSLPVGQYVARAENDEGEACAVKFVKK